MVQQKPIGRVVHYYSGIGVAAIDLMDVLKVGDRIRIRGSTTDFSQEVESMQIENSFVKEAKKGNSVGIKVEDKVRANDLIYKE